LRVSANAAKARAPGGQFPTRKSVKFFKEFSMQEHPTNLIDINELSRRLSVPKGTIYNWCYLKRIPFIKAGRSLRFDPDEVINSLPHSPILDLAAKR
jgi:excisionase family DNA binding protein